MTDITIYHNPACGTSRNTLALIRNSGAEPTVILYLKSPPSRDELKKLGTSGLVYLVPNLLLRGLNVLLTPLYARALSPADVPG